MRERIYRATRDRENDQPHSGVIHETKELPSLQLSEHLQTRNFVNGVCFELILGPV